jgi:hypothetical protein
MPALVALLIVLLASSSFAAQSSAPAQPALLADGGRTPTRLRLAKMSTEARIFGDLVTVTVTMTFANPEDRQREGDLYFPLPEGAAVCGYALDIQGVMVDGVVVDRQQGERAYETIVRRLTDPALLELVKGNTFRARVFPIPAEGTRTIAVRYVIGLVQGADGVRLELPVTCKDKVDELHVRIEAVRTDGEPKIVGSGMAGLAFTKRGAGFVAEATAKGAALTQPLIVQLPPSDRTVLVEKASDGQTYFRVRVPREALAAKPPAAAPKRITILWDGSGSRAEQAHAREIQFLNAWFARWKAAPVSVDLVVFRHKAAPPQHFEVQDGQAEALLKAIAAVDYDGGTQLGAISPAAGAKPPDAYLLFTDGLSTFGRETPERLGAPVYVFSVGGTADRGVLDRLTLLNGGAFYELADQGDEAVLADMARPRCRFVGADVKSGPIVDLCPTDAHFMTGAAAVFGKIEGDEGSLAIRYGWSDQDARELKVAISSRDAAQGDTLRFMWARGKVADLMASPEPDLKEVARIGKHYGVVTSCTSLIVLESLEQYLEFRIRPPASLPEMRDAYDAAVPGGAEPAAAGKWFTIDPGTARLYDLLVPWYFRLGLWDEEHAYPPDFRYKPSGDPETAPGGVGQIIMLQGFRNSGAGTAGGGGGELFGGSPMFSSAWGSSFGAGGPPRFEVTFVTSNARPARLAAAPPVHDLTATVPESAPPGPPAEGPSDKPPPRRRPAPPADGDTSTLPPPDADTPLWDPETPYLRALASAGPDGAWAAYLAERQAHAASPAFYLDCADFFLHQGDKERGLQVFSNLSELGLVAPLRTMAYRLIQLGMLDLAALALEDGVAAAPEDPHCRYDLAMLLAQQEKYDRAVALLHEALTGECAGYLQGTGATLLMDLNRLLAKADAAAVKRLGLDRRLVRRLDADLRVTVTWDSPAADVDLSVTEPSGEKCSFAHGATTIGGHLWLDVEYGGGPEEYVVRRAMAGTYKIAVTCSFMDAPPLTRPVLVWIRVYTNFGRPDEKCESFVVRLDQEGQTVPVTEVPLGRGAATEAPGAAR